MPLWPTAEDQDSATEDSPDEAEAPAGVMLDYFAEQGQGRPQEELEVEELEVEERDPALETWEEVTPASEAEHGGSTSPEYADDAIVEGFAVLAEPEPEEGAEEVQDVEGGGRDGSRDKRMDEWVENMPRHGRFVSEAEYHDLRMERDAAIETNTKWRHRGVNPDLNPGAATSFRGQKWRPGSQRFANSGGSDRAWHKGYYLAKKKGGDAAAQEYIKRHGPPQKYR